METKVVKAKPWTWEEGSGAYPARVVLLKIKKGLSPDDWTEYSTHVQVDATKDGGTKHFIWGHYFETLKEAEKDFRERKV